MVTREDLPRKQGRAFRASGDGQVGAEQTEHSRGVPLPLAIHILPPGVGGQTPAALLRPGPPSASWGQTALPHAGAQSTSDNLI